MKVDSSKELSTSDDHLKGSSSRNDTTVERSKLFEGKREVFILIGLALIIFSMQAGESIIASFYTLEVSNNIKCKQVVI